MTYSCLIQAVFMTFYKISQVHYPLMLGHGNIQLHNDTAIITEVSVSSHLLIVM